MLVSLVVRDEAFQQEACRLLHAYVLGQAYAALVHAVNQRALGALVRCGNVVQQLHQHAHAPHEQGGNEEEQNQLRVVQMHHDGLWNHSIKEITGEIYENQRHEVGHAHPLQVNERRVANDTRIGAEEAEAYETDGYTQE